MLRILHVGKFYPPYMGGMETHLEALCSELRLHTKVTAIVANTGWRTVEEDCDGVRVIRSGVAFTLSRASVCPAMIAQIRRTPADIVHIHLPNPPGVIAYLASGHTGRLVMTEHGEVLGRPILKRAIAPFMNLAVRRAKALIATSPNYINVSSVLVKRRDCCHVIPYGIPLDTFARSDGASIARLREQYGSRIVVSVGRMVPFKGIEYLVRAMAYVDAQLLILGEGPLRKRMETVARSVGVQSRVHFLGSIPNRQIGPYLHAASVFAMPSIENRESFGIVQIEAMACGTPVINTALDSGVPFVSLDGVTGLTVPPANAEALAVAMNLLLANPDLRQRFGQAGRERVRKEFSVELMGQRMMRLYEGMMRA